MPAKNNTDRINELFTLVVNASSRLDALREEVQSLWEDQGKAGESHVSLKDSFSHMRTDITLVVHRVEILEKTKELRIQRIWSIAGPIVGAILDILGTILFKK
jgi:hypothetical protein